VHLLIRLFNLLHEYDGHVNATQILFPL